MRYVTFIKNPAPQKKNGEHPYWCIIHTPKRLITKIIWADNPNAAILQIRKSIPNATRIYIQKGSLDNVRDNTVLASWIDKEDSKNPTKFFVVDDEKGNAVKATRSTYAAAEKAANDLNKKNRTNRFKVVGFSDEGFEATNPANDNKKHKVIHDKRLGYYIVEKPEGGIAKTFKKKQDAYAYAQQLDFEREFTIK